MKPTKKAPPFAVGKGVVTRQLSFHFTDKCGITGDQDNHPNSNRTDLPATPRERLSHICNGFFRATLMGDYTLAAGWMRAMARTGRLDIATDAKTSGSRS